MSKDSLSDKIFYIEGSMYPNVIWVKDVRSSIQKILERIDRTFYDKVVNKCLKEIIKSEMGRELAEK